MKLIGHWSQSGIYCFEKLSVTVAQRIGTCVCVFLEETQGMLTLKAWNKVQLL